MLNYLPLVNKAKKPKFELHLRIYDLNNVPLVSGVSQIKWHLPHSISGEHRGRTNKCPIANHKVEYNYAKVVPLRIHIDRANNLDECPIEFEVLQEFGAAEEKIFLGKVSLNLSEYVEESEAILRERPATAPAHSSGIAAVPANVAAAASNVGAAVADKLEHQVGRLSFGHTTRSRSSTRNSGPPPASPGKESSATSITTQDDESSTSVREGIIRRHLMQESKINSTLKIGILMVQVDGDRNFIAPPLRTAPVFGGIAGIGLTGEQADQDDVSSGHVPITSKSRGEAEVQDMYRTSLAAAIVSPPVPGELSADACIEDIFSGGSGFTEDLDNESYGPRLGLDGGSRGSGSNGSSHRRQRSQRSAHFTNGSLAPPSGYVRDDTGSPSSENDGSSSAGGGGVGGGTLRPRDVKAFFARENARQGHRRQRSGASDRSARTLVMTGLEPEQQHRPPPRNYSNNNLRRGRERADSRGDESLASFETAGAGSSSSDGDGFRRAREVDEFEVRDDLVAWQIGCHVDVRG